MGAANQCRLGRAAAADIWAHGAPPSLPTGASLSVCQTADNQCCTQDYLDRVRRELGQDLLDGLKEQLENREDELEDILHRFSDCELIRIFNDAKQTSV